MGLPQQGVGGPGGGIPSIGTGVNIAPGTSFVNPDDPTKQPVATIGPDGGPPTYTENPYANPPPPPAAPAAPAAGPAAPTAPVGPGLLSDPGPFEQHAQGLADAAGGATAATDLYKAHGGDLVNNDSYSENLYKQGIGQLDPYYDYAQRMGERSINDAAAAHGGFSTAALTQIGNLDANLRGQQAREMIGLAGQADKSKLDRYGAGFDEAAGADKGTLDRIGAEASLYSTWQDKQEGRLGGALAGQKGISDAEAGQIDKFYTNLNESGKYDAESINAALQAAGVDPNSAFGKDLLSFGSALGKAYAGSAGK